MKTTNRTIRVTAPGSLALACLLSVLLVAPAHAVHHDTAANAGLQNLSFARHVDTPFTLTTANTAMTNATTVIGACDATPTADQDVACQVTMQVAGGTIGSFGAVGDGGDVISSNAEMNALINSGTANVMVVTAIGFCSGPAGPGLTIIGCGNVGARGIVSVNTLAGNLLGVEITHEFLHNQGHGHRGDAGEAAMTPGAVLNPVLSLNSNIINEAECASMHTGASYTAANNGPIVDPPPIITCPAPITVECTSSSGVLKSNPTIAAFLAAVSATHGCEPAPTLTDNAPAVFTKGTTGVKFTATDPDWLHSSSECTANVTVVDNTPPSITCPLAITVECTQSGGTPSTHPAIAAFLAGATATDICDPSPTITNNAPAFFPDGTTHVTFTAKDHDNNASQCIADVHVVDSTPPAINCPATITLECNDHCSSGGVPATDAAIVAFLSGASATDVCDPSPVITDNHPACFALGETPVTFTATDHSGNHASCVGHVRVVDTTPPVITVMLNKTVLWPPDHKMVNIAAAVTVTDICDPAPTFVLSSITSNEPINGLGDGDTAPDWVGASLGTPDAAFQLRAERSGKGSGRRYTIVYTAFDLSGNRASTTVIVFVPHDQSGRALVVEDLDPAPHIEPIADPDIKRDQDRLASGSAAAQRVIPTLTRLARISPNPFDVGTVVAFDLAADREVGLAVYDLRGALVRTLRSGRLPAGRYNAAWDGRDRHGNAVRGGVYLVRFVAGGQTFTRKAILMK